MVSRWCLLKVKFIGQRSKSQKPNFKYSCKNTITAKLWNRIVFILGGVLNRGERITPTEGQCYRSKVKVRSSETVARGYALLSTVPVQCADKYHSYAVIKWALLLTWSRAGKPIGGFGYVNINTHRHKIAPKNIFSLFLYFLHILIYFQ